MLKPWFAGYMMGVIISPTISMLIPFTHHEPMANNHKQLENLQCRNINS
jgi:hypothetical protein